MPNGRPRQRNTRHANSQRQRHSVVAEPVVDEAPPVVIQAEVVSTEETNLLQHANLRAIEAMDNIARVAGVPEDHEHFGHFQVTINEINKIKGKYEMAKEGTLLGFQEVELEDKDKEINDLTYMLEKTMEKLQDTIGKLKQCCEENKKLLKDGQRAYFLYQIVQNTSLEDGAHIHLGDGRVVKVLTKEEAEVVQREVESDEGARRLTNEEIMEVMGLQ